MIEKIKEIAKNILLLEERRRKLAELLRAESSPYFEGAYEKSFIRGIDEIKVNGKVCATDSGIMLGAMHGIDIFVCRAVAVSFLYENSTLKSCEYYPSPRADPEIEVKNALDIEDVLWNSSLFRLKSEIEVSINAVEKLSPDYLFLDGSIVPLVSDKPKTESQVIGVYNEVIRLYIRLYERCREKNCTLVGIIKDSRGKRFLEIVQSLISDESIISSARDSDFVHHLLKEKERTFVFGYSSDPYNHKVLRDLGYWQDKICVFYLKPSPYDRPLRCEFLCEQKNLDKKFDQIASFVYSLSKINEKYAYPAILIEADLRAAVSNEELIRIKRRLEVEVGLAPSIMELRRNVRPFR